MRRTNLLISYTLQLGMDFDALKSESSAVQFFPFNSEKKRGGVAVKSVMFFLFISSHSFCRSFALFLIFLLSLFLLVNQHPNDFLIHFQPDSSVHIHWKGAAEIVLGSCTHYMDESESFVDMSEDKVSNYVSFYHDRVCLNVELIIVS